MSPAAQNKTEGRRVALFVLGMNRSGTSALTRVLSLCGGVLPTGLMGAMPDNPLGHWEPRAANYLNEGILSRRGSTLFDPTLRMWEKGSLQGKGKVACIGQIRTFLRTLPAEPLVVIKDPRITVLSDLWFEAARLDGLDIVTVIAVRHPQEVIGSVAASSGASPELASALWLKYNLLAERDTRGVPRVFVEYANLLQDWRREVARISAALAVDLDNRDEEATDEFLREDLHRQRVRGPLAEPFGTDWVSTVYDALCAAAQDQPVDRATLDRVFDAYRASEYGFRKVLEDFNRYHRLNRLFRPSIMRLFGETLAVGHRRSGTWA
ncbi:sulfotransferase family protein [Mycobacterium sp. 94-17]|uniref:sulfotransferase family protein n=1 Tax=Mycobacterium sp. 94-17 TaxID=2986147 RepID=UPI002D1ED19D|nr:sulfotransferase family protein [Mycobacterium sp. 94-17]MEB4212255.1 sulfotransferase family protein [Mycobacterium sp. 94-17]